MNSKNILILILVSSVCVSICQLNRPLLASSPVVPFTLLTGKPPVKFQLTHPDTPFKILAVDYHSDGKSLNATIWLPSYISMEGLQFGMRVRIGAPYQTLYNAYMQIEKNGLLSSHMKQFISVLPAPGKHQLINATLDELHAITGSYVKGSRVMHLTLNLGGIGSPSQYAFSVFLSNKTTLLDETVIDNVPPFCALSCVHVKLPSIVVGIAGEQVHVPVTIDPGNATKFLYSDFLTNGVIYKISLTSNPPFPIKLNSSPVTIPYIPHPGLPAVDNISDVFITIPSKMKIGNYSLPTNATFTAKNIPPYTLTLFNKLNLEVLPPPTTSRIFIQKVSSYLANNPLIPVAITTAVVIGMLRFVDINNSSILKSLTISDIMQVDGTVIVGVLILLTLGSSSIAGFHRTTTVIGVVTASIVYPFALSVIRVVTKGTISGGIKLTIAGFVYLMVAVVVLSFVQ